MDRRTQLEARLAALHEQIEGIQAGSRPWFTQIQRALVDSFGERFLATFEEALLRENLDCAKALSNIERLRIKHNRTVTAARISRAAGIFINQRVKWFFTFSRGDFQRAFSSHLRKSPPSAEEICRRYRHYLYANLSNAINEWVGKYAQCFTPHGFAVSLVEFVHFHGDEPMRITSNVRQAEFSAWVESLNTTIETFLGYFAECVPLEIEYEALAKELEEEKIIAQWRR